MKKIILTSLFIGSAMITSFAQDMTADAKKLSELNCKMLAVSQDKSLSDQEFYDKQKELTDQYEALKKECEKKYKDRETEWKAALSKASKESGC